MKVGATRWEGLASSWSNVPRELKRATGNKSVSCYRESIGSPGDLIHQLGSPRAVTRPKLTMKRITREGPPKEFRLCGLGSVTAIDR